MFFFYFAWVENFRVSKLWIVSLKSATVDLLVSHLVGDDEHGFEVVALVDGATVAGVTHP